MDQFYLEGKFNPNIEQQKLLDHILGDNFPWFFRNQKGGQGKDYNCFSHFLVHRPEKVSLEKIPGTVNSEYFEAVANIVVEICRSNNVEISTIHRAVIHNSYYHPVKFGAIHTDHNFPHKQLIWYLNDFTQGPTYIFNEQNEIIKETKFDKNCYCIFNGFKHAQGFCAPYENRVVVVFTFN
jgi:hypothetical protein